MLINEIMNFCDDKYNSAHTGVRCYDCRHVGECTKRCKQCLEEIHYPRKYPNGKKDYDCPNLINFYVCDYTYKYATEIYRLIQKSEALKKLSEYRLFTVGCGGCPDLMAFEAHIIKNGLKTTVDYRGIDKNPLWEPIHDKVRQYASTAFNGIDLSIDNAFEFLEQYCIGERNVLVLQYIISALYISDGADAVDRLFDLLIESVVKWKKPTEPFVILINDVNSINMGRDMCINLPAKLREAGYHGNYYQFYFDENIRNNAQRYGEKHEKSSAMPPEVAARYQQYEPWQFCTSAQMLIEIEGDET